MSRVYLGRLSNRAQEGDIDRFFRGFGKINDVMLKNGYAFIEFDRSRDAADAVQELNGTSLCGERVIVEHARGTPRGGDFQRDVERGYVMPSRFSPPQSSYRGGGGGGIYREPPRRTNYRIIVKNLSSRVSWQDLKEFMRKAGDVEYADAHKERKNEGIVEFACYRDVKRALEKLDGYDLHGRNIEIIDDSSSRDRERRRSRTRSRSGERRSDGDSRRRRRRASTASESRSRSRDRKRRGDDSPNGRGGADGSDVEN